MHGPITENNSALFYKMYEAAKPSNNSREN